MLLAATLPGTSSPNYLIVIGATAAVYLFLLMAIILFGKKELTQLSITDLIFILLISNSVQNAMVNGDLNSLQIGIVSAFTLFVLNYLFKYLTYHYPQLNKLIEGEPVSLIENGRMNTVNLKKQEITQNELEAAIRENGFSEVSEVMIAKLETDGNISIVGFKDVQKIAFKTKRHHVPQRLNKD